MTREAARWALGARRAAARVTTITVLAASLAATGSASAAHHGDNGLITFWALTPNEGAQLFTVHPNGHNLRQITHRPGEAFNPDWSPDGRKITYEHAWDTETVCATVDLINPDGSNRSSLTSGMGGCEGQPAFTPSGAIVYEHFDFATEDDGIWGMAGDGGNQHHIISPWPNGAGGATDPNVSPSGQLTFAGTDFSLIGPTDPAQGLFGSDLSGSGFHELLPMDVDLAIKHDWAPDGEHIVVTTNANLFHADATANIATIRPDGSGLHYLTDYQGGDVKALVGSYSPNGRDIVFRLEDHGLYALMTMRADGSHLRTILPFSTFRPRGIDWGPRVH
jgi:Tol biopolymer transport system component